MPPGVEQWIWVLDFHGFGLRDGGCLLLVLQVFIAAHACDLGLQIGWLGSRVAAQHAAQVCGRVCKSS